MQELIVRAKELLTSGEVTRVLGWRKGENVWEICKSFSAKKDELMEINHLTEDILQSPKMLIVPLM